VKPRRQGDVLNLTAVAKRAHEELKWEAKKTLEEACKDLWRWVKNNPTGYREQHKSELLDSWKKEVKMAGGLKSGMNGSIVSEI